jgi:hypothetical protein
MGETRKKLLLAVYTVFAQARQDRAPALPKVRLDGRWRHRPCL